MYGGRGALKNKLLTKDEFKIPFMFFLPLIAALYQGCYGLYCKGDKDDIGNWFMVSSLLQRVAFIYTVLP